MRDTTRCYCTRTRRYYRLHEIRTVLVRYGKFAWATITTRLVGSQTNGTNLRSFRVTSLGDRGGSLEHLPRSGDRLRSRGWIGSQCVGTEDEVHGALHLLLHVHLGRRRQPVHPAVLEELIRLSFRLERRCRVPCVFSSVFARRLRRHEERQRWAHFGELCQSSLARYPLSHIELESLCGVG